MPVRLYELSDTSLENLTQRPTLLLNMASTDRYMGSVALRLNSCVRLRTDTSHARPVSELLASRRRS